MIDAAGTTNHTPGPWAYEQWPDSGGFPRPVVVAQGSRAVACVSREDGYANARLIAAAPDLLAACEAQSAAVEHEGRCVECFSGVCAEGHRLRYRAAELRGVALAKARGDGHG
jgi:hypothetical protein